MADNQEHHLRLFTRNTSRILWEAERVSQTYCSRSGFRLQNQGAKQSVSSRESSERARD